MPAIPNIIIEHGFESIGLLSTMYINKSTQDFFAGLFTLADRLQLVIRLSEDEYIYIPVNEKHILGLFKGEYSLLELVRNATRIDSIPNDEQSSEKRTKYIFKMFYRTALGKIKTISNAFYLWNEYSYSRELKKHLV
jgi:hypothetical protein